MEIALIHNNTLELGPIGYNIKLINSELENFELEDFITPQDYENIPIHFSDNLTHLLPIEKNIPDYDSKYSDLGNFTWEIIEENGIPTKVLFDYPVVDKTLEQVKNDKKQFLAPIRRQKENNIITLTINNTEVQVSTSREERILLSSKLASSTGLYNFKFLNTWLQIDAEDIQYILNQIDIKVQEAFDWELQKIQEIESCQTIDEVYDVVIYEYIEQTPEPPNYY